MARQLVSYRSLLLLTVGAMVLLLACLVALGLAQLLGATGDVAGSLVLKYVALALRILSEADQHEEPPE